MRPRASRRCNASGLIATLSRRRRSTLHPGGRTAMDRRNAELDEYLRALEGLDYPTSRSAIINRATDNGGLDTEVLRVLQRLPDRTYSSRDQILAHVRRDDATRGALGPSPAPAAPSPLDDRDKNL